MTFGPVPPTPMKLDPEDVVEMARAAAEKALTEAEKVAMWSAS